MAQRRAPRAIDVASSSNESPYKPLDEKGRAVVGYFCAVNTATLSFIIYVAPNWPLDIFSVVFLFSYGFFSWFVILFGAMLPAVVAYAVARWRRIHSIVYYAACSAVISAAGRLLFIYMFPGEDAYDPTPVLESYLWMLPVTIAIGTVGGVTFWYKAGRHLSNTRRPVGTSRRDILFRRLAFAGAATLCLVFPGYVVTPVVEHFWSQSHCATETRQKISNLSGFDFETTRTACSPPGRPTWVRVFASPAGRNEEMLLFEFEPGNDRDLPIISVTDPTHILVAIPHVLDVRRQVHDWGNVHVEYRIAPLIYHYDNRGPREP